MFHTADTPRIVIRFRTTMSHIKMSCFRHCVSGNHIRYIDNNYDLDLSFITDKLVASGCPAFGTEQLYRNPHRKMERFCDSRFGDNYYVFNLCSEKERQYTGLFGGRVFNFPHPDHYAAPLELLFQCVLKAVELLRRATRPTLIIHCKAGKGRSGTIICCILLYLGYLQHVEITPNEALTLFAKKRGEAIKYPCQIRSVYQFDRFLKRNVDAFASTPTKQPQIQNSRAQVNGMKIISNSYQRFVVRIMCTRGMLNAADAQRFAHYSFSMMPEDEYREDPRAEIKIILKKFEIDANQSAPCKMELFNNTIIEIFTKEKG